MIVKEPEQKLAQAPAGVHAAVCVDEIDMGKLPNRFDPEAAPVPTVRLMWQIAEEDPKTGHGYIVKKDYRASLHEKSGLRKDLQAWRGREFTFDELVGFDLENIIGVSCMLNMVEKTGSKGGKFTNISSIMPLMKGIPKPESSGYVRQKDRTNTAEPEPSQWHADDSDVPF